MIEAAIAIAYTLSLLFIFLFSLGQWNLTWFYLKSKRQSPISADPEFTWSELPQITVQLPIYNELYVVERLIESIIRFDYPSDKLEIQVLDDSTDQTRELARNKVEEARSRGINIKHITRPDRTGFKAGALQHGLEMATGEFIAIFDADFEPASNFLIKTIGHFRDPKIGVVQTRWSHLNQDYSLLTRLQAFGLDAHFSIEQVGRNVAGSFINFNGTAGVWRKQCIIDAGGWSFDVLTEDLDLSYRAQIKGWKFKFLEDVDAPAELPVIMSAIKSQQYRWNKGAAETARKSLGNVFRSKLSPLGKVHAFFHLLNSSVFVCLLVAAVLSVPVLFVKFIHPGYSIYFHLGGIFMIGFLSITYFYWVSSKTQSKRIAYFLKTYPLFLIVSMGLSLHNGVAVMEGLLGIKTPFVRTPKFNIRTQLDSWKGNVYINPRLTLLTIFEGILCLYFLFGIGAGIMMNDFGLILFHLMLSLGFAMVFYYSIKPVRHAA